MSNSKQPNILFISMDDMNEWFGYLGVNPDVKTPNVDRLAAEGMAFSNAVCASPVCNPSRTAFLTGMRPSTSGCYMLNDMLEDSPKRHEGIPFPLHFKRNGYHTMVGGKVDHGGGPIDHSTRKTFDESMWSEDAGFFNGQQFDLHSPYAECMTETPGVHSFASHWGPLDDEVEDELSDVQVSRWACEKLNQDYDKPFLLAAGFFRPHLPLIAPKRYFDMYSNKESLWLPPTGSDDMEGMPAPARQMALASWQDYGLGCHRQVMEQGKRRDITQAYLACASFVDDCIGQILQALENSKYADNTIVVLASDNGWGLGEHFHWKKWSIFDNGSNIPFIIKAPGMGGMGNGCEAGVDLTDIYPTLVDLCGLPDPGHLDGQTLRPLLSGEADVRERPGLTSFGPHNHSLRTDQYRYTRYADGSEELYDYGEDPWEHNNVAQKREYEEVKERLAKWLPENPAPALDSSPAPGQPLELEPGAMRWFRAFEDGFADRAISIRATVKLEGDNAVIVHHGGYFAGYALYVKDCRLCMSVQDVETPLRWDRLDPKRTVVESQTPLPERKVDVEGKLERDGTITLKVDGETVATGKAESALSIYPTGLLEAGQYSYDKYPPMGDYEKIETFPGAIEDILVVFAE
ncbi:MAG: sulfatase [Candidatus Sumerlaeota bacterium]